MLVRAQCSNSDCGHVYMLSDELLGKNVRCKRCRQTFTVTASQETSIGASSAKSDTAEVLPEGGSSQRLGRFEVHERLGGGAFGVVYRAFDPQLDREVALKVPRAGTLDRPGAVERFMREAKAAAQLRHPNIVPIYDAGRDGDQHYIASAFIAGQPLENAVEAGPVEPRRAARIVRELAEAFDYAHSQGIIHRDIKPANVMLDKKDHPHVMDFGLARLDSMTAKLTQDGTIMGTPAYMSPEQASGQNDKVNAASDQYSLGVLFYELLTGHTPFGGPPQVVIINVLKTPPKPPREVNADIPRDLETICLKAMAKEPDRRYGSCREFAEDLRRWLNGEPISARRVSPVERLFRWCRRNPVMAILITTAAMLLVAVAGISTTAAVRLKVLADRERTEIERANQETRNAQLERAKAQTLANDNAALAEKEKRTAESERQQTKLAKQHLYAAHMNLIQSAWEDARIGAMQDLLEQWRPENAPTATGPNNRLNASDDLRGFEWYYWGRMSGSYSMNLTGHNGDIEGVVFSPDGKFLFSVSNAIEQQGEVRKWDAKNGQLLLRLPGHSGYCSRLAMSPDGKCLAAVFSVVNKPGVMFVWDATTGRELLNFKVHSSQVLSVAFSPDGKQLATSSLDNSIKIWNITTGMELLTLNGHTKAVRNVTFSPDGKWLASASGDKTIKVWDSASGIEARTLDGHSSDVMSVAFSPDGKCLASASYDRTIKLWNAATGMEMLTWNGQANGIPSLAFSPDGTQLASAGYDQTIKVWDAMSGTELLTLKGHTGIVMSAAFSPDGKRLASAGYDRTVKVWNLTSRPEPITYKGHLNEVRNVVFSTDGKRLATSSDSVRIWDMATGQELLRVYGYGGIALSNDGSLLASTNNVSLLEVRDISKHPEILKWKKSSPALSVAFSPDGSQLASGNANYTINVWDANTGGEKLTLTGHTGLVGSVAFSPDGKRLASASRDHTVRLWDAEGGGDLLILKGHTAPVNCVIFSKDGKRLASASEDQSMKVWDVATGLELITINGNTGNVSGVAFSPDGTRLASASGLAVKLWDATSGLEMIKLKGHSDRVLSIAFSPDGTRLVSGSADKTVKVWDSRTWPQQLKAE